MGSINNFPDEILGKILSSLPTKKAASTSILSKPWRNLLPFVDDLSFDDSISFDSHKIREETTIFSDFVDKTLAISSPIKKFSLTLNRDHFDEDDESCVSRWIHSALERACLDLYLIYLGRELFIDSALFTSTRLVNLTIYGGFYLDASRGGLFLPSLKTLALASVSFDMVKFFFYGCPKLEDLYISVVLGYFGVKLNTPSFAVSTYGNRLVFESLVKASLDIHVYKSDIFVETMWKETYGTVTSLIKGLSNVKTLNLSARSLKVFLDWPMPVLDSLLSLFIESDELNGWEVMPRLLDNSPNLQNLVIKGLVHKVTEWCGDACACIRMKDEDEVCCLSYCRVKVLEISGYKGSFRELKQMRHFLGKLEYLETVKVGGIEEDINNLRANLLALPTASPTCKIQFI